LKIPRIGVDMEFADEVPQRKTAGEKCKFFLGRRQVPGVGILLDIEKRGGRAGKAQPYML